MKNKNITPRNKKGLPHGYWEVYWSNDSLWYKGFYDNCKRVGYLESYWNKELDYKTYYI